jgi:hypothetical protein
MQGCRKGGRTPIFGTSVNPNYINQGADYNQHITTSPSGFLDLLTALLCCCWKGSKILFCFLFNLNLKLLNKWTKEQNLTTIGGPWYFWKGTCTPKAQKLGTLSWNHTFTKVKRQLGEGFKGIKKISLQPQKKNEAVFYFFYSFQIGISTSKKKVFMPTSKMYIKTLYVKRFRSYDLFVSSTLPQRGCFLAAAATPNKHSVAM